MYLFLLNFLYGSGHEGDSKNQIKRQPHFRDLTHMILCNRFIRVLFFYDTPECMWYSSV